MHAAKQNPCSGAGENREQEMKTIELVEAGMCGMRCQGVYDDSHLDEADPSRIYNVLADLDTRYSFPR